MQSRPLWRDGAAMLDIRNDHAELRRMSAWLHACLDNPDEPDGAFAVTHGVIMEFDVCANEAVTNIIDYAYDDDAVHLIRLELRLRDDGLCLTIADDGVAFDPLAVEPAPVPASLADARIGGLGVVLMRRLMHCAYERRAGLNVLTLRARARVERPSGPVTNRRRGVRRQPPATAATPAGVERRRNPERRALPEIAHVRLFNGVAPMAVAAVLRHCAQYDFDTGDVLLDPARPNEGLHVLLSGRARIHLDETGSEVFAHAVAGDCIGEMSIIDGQPVSAWVVADRPGCLLTIPSELFWSELMTLPGVGRNLLRAMAQRVRADNKAMLERLRDSLELETLQKELNIARQLQEGMLPSQFPIYPDLHCIDLHAVMQAARNVGGDFYDVFLVAPQRLFISIGDVSGKGIPAALFMARSMTLLRMEAAKLLPPDMILEQANNQLCDNNDSCMFVTVFCGILDLASGRLVYAAGGHNPPLVGESGQGYQYLRLPRSVMLGVAPGRTFARAELQLAPGQTLMLYTDGVTEALDEHGEFYGEGRFAALLGEAPPGDSRQLIALATEALATFAGKAPQADDITMLALRWNGTIPSTCEQ